jgi:hypothetical protein
MTGAFAAVPPDVPAPTCGKEYAASTPAIKAPLATAASTIVRLNPSFQGRPTIMLLMIFAEPSSISSLPNSPP